MKFSVQGLFLPLIMVTVLAPTSSHAVVTLESVLDARRAIVQHDSKRTETIALSEQNSARISGLNDKIFEIEKSLQEIKQDIEKNEKGMSEFPEMVGNFQPKITALITSKAKLLNQRKKNQSNIKRLKVENNELTTKAKEHKINSDKQKKRLGNLKQSYLDRHY
jgi:chromosome segregation ATPase